VLEQNGLHSTFVHRGLVWHVQGLERETEPPARNPVVLRAS
jgi:hypothetical protein